jgi:hypothetical protein
MITHRKLADWEVLEVEMITPRTLADLRGAAR